MVFYVSWSLNFDFEFLRTAICCSENWRSSFVSVITGVFDLAPPFNIISNRSFGFWLVVRNIYNNFNHVRISCFDFHVVVSFLHPTHCASHVRWKAESDVKSRRSCLLGSFVLFLFSFVFSCAHLVLAYRKMATVAVACSHSQLPSLHRSGKFSGLNCVFFMWLCRRFIFHP